MDKEQTIINMFESAWHNCDGIILTVWVDGKKLYLNKYISINARWTNINNRRVPRLSYDAHYAMYIRGDKFCNGGELKILMENIKNAHIAGDSFTWHEVDNPAFPDNSEAIIELAFAVKQPQVMPLAGR